MPFDGSQRVLPAHQLLHAAISEAGLTPLDTAFLDEHKARQLREHPPGWIYRHRAVLLPAQALALLTGVAAYGLLCSTGYCIWGLAVGLLTFCLTIASLSLRVRGPAHWQERKAGSLRTVHPALRSAAERLKDAIPETEFVVGELFQDHVQLDPYLLAEYRGARVVLGIWEGEKLIASA